MRIPFLKPSVWLKPIFFIALLLALAGCSDQPLSGDVFSFPQQRGRTKVVTGAAKKIAPQPVYKKTSDVRFEYFESEVEAEPTSDVIERAASRFAAHKGEITSLVMHPTLPIAYTSGIDGKVIEHRLIRKSSATSWSRLDLSGMESKVLLKNEGPISALAISPDAKTLAVAEQGQVTLYDFESKKITSRMTRIGGRITTLAWDPRGELLAFGLANGGIYIWNIGRGGYAAEDTFDALEYYAGGISAIVSIEFHPSGRAFFTVEREGIVGLWRLLRTEEELGLRDTWAAIDKPNNGRREEVFAKLKLQFEDSWLSANGSIIAIAGGSGQIFRWKTRGLKPQTGIETEQGTAFSVTAFEAPFLLPNSPIYLTIGRSRGARFWCFPAQKSSHSSTVVSTEDEQARLVFETDAFGSDIAKARASSDSEILWIAEKTGSLLTLDLKTVTAGDSFREGLSACAN